VLCNITVTKILEIIQDQGRAEVLGQFVEAKLELRRINIRERLGRPIHHLAGPFQGNQMFPTMVPDPVKVSVPQDAKKPSFGPPPIPQLTQLQLSLTQGFLSQIFGVGGRTTESVGIPIQGLVMALHQLLHLPSITRQIHQRDSTNSMNPRARIYSKKPAMKGSRGALLSLLLHSLA
jgi:hypothetical protein